MPAHQAVLLGKGNFDQGAATGPIHTATGAWRIQSTMGGANQPLAGGVKKSVGLEIHFHSNMAAAVQVSVYFAPKADGECPATLALVQHVKGHRQTTVLQVRRMA